MQYELDRRIEKLLYADPLREYLFDYAYQFAKCDIDSVNWDIIENGSSIQGIYLYFSNELINYIEVKRKNLINMLIETELKYENNQIDKQELFDLIIDIEREDEYHLRQIVSLRKYMNYAS